LLMGFLRANVNRIHERELRKAKGEAWGDQAHVIKKGPKRTRLKRVRGMKNLFRHQNSKARDVGGGPRGKKLPKKKLMRKRDLPCFNLPQKNQPNKKGTQKKICGGENSTKAIHKKRREKGTPTLHILRKD